MWNWNYNNFFDGKTKKIQKVTLIKSQKILLD